MKNRLLLFLSAQRFLVHTYRSGIMSHGYEFDNNQEGHRQFAEFLQLHRYPAVLLTDLIEEDFRTETVPHLRGKNRLAQQQRKFDQFYRNTLFRQAILHQRLQEGRRDDEMLFSALTNPHLITQWLDIMHAQQAALIGVYSVPTISKPLLKDIPEEHILLLSWEKSAGLRQSYFNNKRLYLSRLSPVNEGSSFASVVAAETTRTLQYLKSLSLLPLGETLNVYTICHANDRSDLQQRLHDADDISHHYLDIGELSDQLKSEGDNSDSDATGMLLRLLAAHPPASHYAPPEYTHYYKLHQLRRRLFQLSVLTALASLLWSTVSLWQGYALNVERGALERQAQELTQRTQNIIREFPHKLASPADMKSAVTSLHTLNALSPPPQMLWSKLSLALNDYPRIRVDDLSWQTSGSGIADLQGPGMLLSGELDGWDGDYRGALVYLEHFQQALKQRGYTVAALALPLDVSSKGSIAEKPGDKQGKAALFSLKITWGQS